MSTLDQHQSNDYITIDEIKIPTKWCELLAEVRALDPNAIIAGGAIRDLFYGVEYKDIDFFTTTIPQWGLLEQGFDYEGMKYVQAVGAMTKDDMNVNFIIIEPNITNMALIESFDFGICQIAFDGSKIIKSSAFDWDFKHNVMTMRHIDRYQRSIHRYCRINQRYNMDISIPQLESMIHVNP